jgi:hypothetical protein
MVFDATNAKSSVQFNGVNLSTQTFIPIAWGTSPSNSSATGNASATGDDVVVDTDEDAQGLAEPDESRLTHLDIGAPLEARKSIWTSQ